MHAPREDEVEAVVLEVERLAVALRHVGREPERGEARQRRLDGPLREVAGDDFGAGLREQLHREAAAAADLEHALAAQRVEVHEPRERAAVRALRQAQDAPVEDAPVELAEVLARRRRGARSASRRRRTSDCGSTSP